MDDPAWIRSRTIRILVWLAAITVGAAMANVDPPATDPSREALVLALEGALGPASADFVIRGIERGRDEAVAVVVLRMDTPGGLDASMREIIRAILASPVPVLTYVGPSGARAASAGTYILYASHVAAMAPGTNLGAATPVALGGERLPFGRDEEPRRPPEGSAPDSRLDGQDKQRSGAADKESNGEEGSSSKKGNNKEGGDRDTRSRDPGSASEAKAINDAVAYIRSLAELRGRNADWAEAAVRQAESLSASDALSRKVIDFVVPDIDRLLEQADGMAVSMSGENAPRVLRTAGLAQRAIEPDWRSRLLGVITNPSLALILMTIGFYGLMFEFMNPGAVYPGAIGGISLLLGLYALSVLPVNYAGLGLILLGLLLMVGEAFTPSAGAAALGGIVAFALGATILIDTEVPGFAIPWGAIAAVSLASAAFSLLVLRLFWRSRSRPVKTGERGMLDEPGTVLEWSGTRGRVLAAGERWHAVSDAELEPGQRVRVVAVEGLVLHVVAQPPMSLRRSAR